MNRSRTNTVVDCYVTMDANASEPEPSSNLDSKDGESDGADDQVPGSSLADRTATAYHEAGHAVMAVMLGRSIEKVTISAAKLQTGGRRLGLCKVQKGRTKPSKDELEDDVLILLAGMVAESTVTGRYCEVGASSDFALVERLLDNRAKNQRQLERLVKRAIDKTEHLLADAVAAKAIELIAKDVLQRETISGRAVRHLFRQAEQQCS